MRFQERPRCGPDRRITPVLGEEDELESKIKFYNFRMIRLKTTFTDITADTLYDVLHDPIYRKVRVLSQQRK